MNAIKSKYPASLSIDYPGRQDRLTSLFRIILSIPILVVLGLLTGLSKNDFMSEVGKKAVENGGSITAGLFAATALMIIFRQRYPRWWFDFALELYRFTSRVGAYIFLLTDAYPSTDKEQSVHIQIKYPDVKNELNRWLPLVKWFLAIPHYIVLTVLMFASIIATVIAWFSILFTGKYPKVLFDFVVGVGRWSLRVHAYAILLTTDAYPPFSLD